LVSVEKKQSTGCPVNEGPVKGGSAKFVMPSKLDRPRREGTLRWLGSTDNVCRTFGALREANNPNGECLLERNGKNLDFQKELASGKGKLWSEDKTRSIRRKAGTAANEHYATPQVRAP